MFRVFRGQIFRFGTTEYTEHTENDFMAALVQGGFRRAGSPFIRVWCPFIKTDCNFAAECGVVGQCRSGFIQQYVRIVPCGSLGLLTRIFHTMTPIDQKNIRFLRRGVGEKRLRRG